MNLQVQEEVSKEVRSSSGVVSESLERQQRTPGRKLNASFHSVTGLALAQRSDINVRWLQSQIDMADGKLVTELTRSMC